MRLVWKGFIPWLQENHEDSKDVVNAVFNDLKNLQDEACSEEFEKQMASPLFTQFETLFVLYLDFLRVNNGKLSEFWISYLDMTEILLRLLCASRECNWELHLSSIRKMLPWCFAYDNVNYAGNVTPRGGPPRCGILLQSRGILCSDRG